SCGDLQDLRPVRFERGDFKPVGPRREVGKVGNPLGFDSRPLFSQSCEPIAESQSVRSLQPRHGEADLNQSRTGRKVEERVLRERHGLPLDANFFHHQRGERSALLVVEEVRVKGKPVPLAKNALLHLSSRPGLVEIRFTVPRLKAPDRLRFRYRLAGLAEEWTAVETERIANFAHLPPGTYRFEVAALEANGPEILEVATA